MMYLKNGWRILNDACKNIVQSIVYYARSQIIIFIRIES